MWVIISRGPLWLNSRLTSGAGSTTIGVQSEADDQKRKVTGRHHEKQRTATQWHLRNSTWRYWGISFMQHLDLHLCNRSFLFFSFKCTNHHVWCYISRSRLSIYIDLRFYMYTIYMWTFVPDFLVVRSVVHNSPGKSSLGRGGAFPSCSMGSSDSPAISTAFFGISGLYIAFFFYTHSIAPKQIEIFVRHTKQYKLLHWLTYILPSAFFVCLLIFEKVKGFQLFYSIELLWE